MMRILDRLDRKIELFVLKRVLIFLPVLTIVDIVFIEQKGAVFAGLAIGSACGLLRFFYMAATLRRILCGGDTGRAAAAALTKSAISLLGAMAVLAAAIVTDLWLFAGATAGILLVPFVLTINSLTEGLGITHNNFE